MNLRFAGHIFMCRVCRSSQGNENVPQFLLTCFLPPCFLLQIETPEERVSPDKSIAGAGQDPQ